MRMMSNATAPFSLSFCTLLDTMTAKTTYPPQIDSYGYQKDLNGYHLITNSYQLSVLVTSLLRLLTNLYISARVISS